MQNLDFAELHHFNEFDHNRFSFHDILFTVK